MILLISHVGTMDLRKLIPKTLRVILLTVVNQIDCSEANREFVDTLAEFAYPRELLLSFNECF